MPALSNLVALFLPMLAQAPPQADALLTVAERSGFRATARHGEVMVLCQELAKAYPKVVQLSELGKSAEGRPLPLLILSDPPVRTPLEAAQSGKLVILAIGNIHAGEVCGKEALPMLAREIAATPHHPLLKDLVLCFAPIYNADGNERVSKDHRPGQDGPEAGMGQRANARGLDLNRDFVRLEAPETRALVRFLNTWKPHVFIDTHTTNGSYHRYTITYDGPKNPAGDHRIIDFARKVYFPAVTSTFEKGGLEAYYYGNFNREHDRWTTYPAEARYGVNYVGLRNRLSILSEAYAYAPYKTRVLATRDFVLDCLTQAAAHKGEVLRLIDEADKAVVQAGRSPRADDRVPIRSDARPLQGAEPILGFVETEKDGRRTRTETSKEYNALVMDDFVATESVVRPSGYLIPAGFSEAVATLQRHGIDVQELREDLELDLEVYHVDEIGPMPSRGWDRQALLDAKVTARKESRRVPAGTLLVKTAQPLGSLAVYLLEPRSEDGLAAWKLFSTGLKAGADYPVARLPQPAAITTIGAEPLAEERKRELPITFDMTRGFRGGGPFSGSPVSPSWIDDDQWLQVREGKLHKVEAKTGRSRPFFDPDALVKALKKLPGLDDRTVQQIAHGTRFDREPRNEGFLTDPKYDGFLFHHDHDLYYARFDGSIAVRLTNHPGEEQWPQFSPDGKAVAFIRDYDLHVVEIANPAERALSTGGRESLRHGVADWVYFEEIFNRRWSAFWWSPDSRRVALMEFEDASLPTLTMLDDTASPRKVEQNKYPRAGEPNPKVRLGVVNVGGGPVLWAELPEYSADSTLISNVGWTPDSSAAYFYVQNRTQTWLDLLSFGGDEGSKPRRLFRDQTKAWIADQPAPVFLKDGSFLWLSERDGWKHVEHRSAEGAFKARLTSGDWEVRSIEHVDPATGWITFKATMDAPMAENLYRVKPGGPIERLSAGEGSHKFSLSPGGRYFLDSRSDPGTPTRVRLHDEAGKLVRTVDTNPVHALKEYRFGPRERFQIQTRDGFPLEAQLLLPPDLDPSRKYPVWFMTYGGPHFPRVGDGWEDGHIWDHALAREGFIVFYLDPRSASGKGAISAWSAFKQLGVKELEDIKEGIGWLKQKPYVDGSRIGMAGHSYGGFMTSYAMTHSDLFAAGIAGAPVTDWRDYDSIYTERFMGLPQDNPEGYDKSSVVKAARNLHGKLLIAHGAIDDNVSLRNTMRFVEALQKAGKDFELMIYPGSRHGIMSPHYGKLQIDFIRRTLGSPGKGKPGETAPSTPRSAPVAARPADHPVGSN